MPNFDNLEDLYRDEAGATPDPAQLSTRYYKEQAEAARDAAVAEKVAAQDARDAAVVHLNDTLAALNTTLGYKNDSADYKTQIEAIKAQTEAIRVATDTIKSDTEAIKSDTDAIKSATNTIKSDTQDIYDATVLVKTQTDTIKSDTQDIYDATVLVKTQTDTIKSDTNLIRSNTQDIYDLTLALKGDTQSIHDATATLKGDVVTLKSDTQGIKDATDVIKSETEALRSATDTIKNDTQLIHDDLNISLSSVDEVIDEFYKPTHLISGALNANGELLDSGKMVETVDMSGVSVVDGALVVSAPPSVIKERPAPLVQSSGAMTLLNGVDQTISPTFASSNYVCYFKDEVFTENKTVGQTSITFDANSTYSALIALADEPTEAQKQFIKDYRHKAVAHYNVNDTYTTPSLPDVTASLNLPSTEVGKYKIDYSNVIGGEVGILSWASQFGQGNVFTVNGRVASLHMETQTNDVYQPTLTISNLTVGKLYNISYKITSTAEMADFGFEHGAEDGSLLTEYKMSSYTSMVYNKIFYPKGNGTSCVVNLLINGRDLYSYDANIIVSVREVTAYEVANYTTSCDLTQQEDGLQMIAFKQNNGILEKLQDDRMNLTGEERPALQLDMTDTQLGNKWFINLVIARELVAKFSYLLYSRHVANNQGMQLQANASWGASAVTLYLFDEVNSVNRTTYINDNLFHIITFENDGTNLTIVVDGVAGAPLAHSFVPSGLNFKDSIQQAPKGEMQIEIGTESLWSKYDRAKNYARLLDIKTNLEAN